MEPLEVRVPASLGMLPTLRALTDAIALHSELTLDEAADLRLAVDEASSALIPAAVVDSPLSCQFRISKDETHVSISALARDEGLPDEQSFGWHVLRTLTNTLTASQEPANGVAGGYPTTITFTRARTITVDPR